MKDIDKSISWNPIPRVVMILHSEKRKLWQEFNSTLVRT